MTRFLELWSLGVIWDGEDEPVDTVRSSDGRALLQDPRSDECKRLGCKVGADGTIEHVELDRKAGASS